MTHSPTSIRRALSIDLGIVAVFVAISVFLQLYWGIGDYGIYHPDEIYQTLEPAHEMVYGFGLHAWEWDIGARNALLPAMLAGVLGLARLLGLEQPTEYLPVMHAFVSSIFSLSAFAVYLLARHFKASRAFALVGVALFLFNPLTLYLGFRVLSEVISTPFILFGLYFALSAGALDPPDTADTAEPADKRARLRTILGFSLLGISVLFRLQNALFVLPVLLPWRFQKDQFQRYQLAMKVLVGWALVFGLIDWITWGLPFASAGAYLRFNLLMGAAPALYGADSAFYYLQYFPISMGAAGVLLLLLPLFSATRARVLLACAALFIALHSFFPHKELRFVIATLPMLAVLSAVGLQWVLDQAVRPENRRIAQGLAAAGLFAAAGWSAWQVPSLTFGDIGHDKTMHLAPETSAYGHFSQLNRLLLAAANKDDICGLLLAEQWAVNAGGHTYFHRDLPFYHDGVPAPSPAVYNYVISQHPPQPDWRALQTLGAYTLYATGRPTCAADPAYQSIIYQPLEDEERP